MVRETRFLSMAQPTKAHPPRQLRLAQKEEGDQSVPSKIRSPPCLISEMKVHPTSRACPPLPSAPEDAHCPGTSTHCFSSCNAQEEVG